MSNTNNISSTEASDAVILSEVVEHVECNENVNKISDNKCDPLLKESCSDNDGHSANTKKRDLSDNENSDDEIIHRNKKYKSSVNDEDTTDYQERNKELCLSTTSSDITTFSDKGISSTNAKLHKISGQGNNNDQNSQIDEESNKSNDSVTELKLETDSSEHDENSEKELHESLKNAHDELYKHIKNTKTVVCCERINLDKFISTKVSSGSEDEETVNKLTSKNNKVKQLKKNKINHKVVKTSDLSDSEDENTNNKKRISNKAKRTKLNKPNMKLEISKNVEKDLRHLDSKNDWKKYDSFSNDINRKITKNKTNINKNDSSDSDSYIKSKKSTKTNFKNNEKMDINNSSESEDDTKIRNSKNVPTKINGKKEINSDSEKSEMEDKSNKSEDLKTSKECTTVSEKNISELESDKSEMEDNNSNNSEDLASEKCTKVSEKNISDSESEKSEMEDNLKTRTNSTTKISKNSIKLNKENVSDSESEKESAKSDIESDKSSGSDSKHRTKKLSKKSSSSKNTSETDSDSESDDINKSDAEDNKTKTKSHSKLEKKSDKSLDKKNDNSTEEKKLKQKQNSEKRINHLKKYLHVAGIRINNFQKFFENIKTQKGKEQKLLDLLQDKGLVGRPTIEKCKKIRKKIETQREIAELDVSNIIATDGRPKRQAFSNRTRKTQERSPSPDKKLYQQNYSRIKALVDSDSD